MRLLGLCAIWVLGLQCASTIEGQPASTRDLSHGRQAPSAWGQGRLPRILVGDSRSFLTDRGKRFVPMGVNYFRPGTGWAPQVWRQFDPEATREDFARLRELGANCVRVFLTFGSFYQEPGVLSDEGLAKFDRFLALAEESGLYVHPTGPDHWEGLPEWARGDRYADEKVLAALESFWRLFALRYRARSVIFAYDLLNEPAIGWDTPVLRERWNGWLAKAYSNAEGMAAAWGETNRPIELGSVPVPPRDAFPGRKMADFQRFREDLAEEWTRRQVLAIKSADPLALVTVGLIQWSVPVVLAGPSQYSGFRPERLAPLLDFMEVHFYPLAGGFYEYAGLEEEARNLAYLESVVREVARCGKPTVVAEFGWYGGGKPTINAGKHPYATQEQQAQWCSRLIDTTSGLAAGWLNWGLYDHPGARDVTEFIGLLSADGELKAWGAAFREIAAQFREKGLPPARELHRPNPDWGLLITDRKAVSDFREQYYQAFKADPGRGKSP